MLLFAVSAPAQDHTHQSVLGQHTWYKLTVTEEGVHQLGRADFQTMGIDVDALNPHQIRLFGNPSGSLPEKNSEARPDDLTEMAICVTGSDDGRFDEDDRVLFYAQEPTRWLLVGQEGQAYQRDRNYYSDSTFYYLCVDSGIDGLRVGEKPTLPVEDATAVIADFVDCVWHEEELFSPFSLGRNWFGERLSSEDTSLSLSFVFPNLVKTKPLKFKAQVLGRISDGNMYFDLWVDDNHLADHAPIKYYGNNYFGRVLALDRQVMLETDTARVTLSMDPDPKASLYLDYVEIEGWRQLKRVGDHFPFRLMPDQFGSGKTAVWVQHVDSECRLWEVTSPLTPVLQNAVLSAGNLVFATTERTEKRYVMFKPQSALEVSAWTALPNQNLHAIGDADMLIVSASGLLQQAHDLADYHAERDGMNSIVVDVNQIYNEFSTGIPDPTAVRDFVRMVYQRSNGNLKYLTLFGRASFDYRNILGTGRDFVPCYEDPGESHHEISYCTDDYFALMDANEGYDCAGRVDIGVGRITVATTEEAATALRKIRHYNDLASTQGLWKTDYLLLADDEVTSYVSHSETLESMLDTLCPRLTAKKVYCGAYPKINTSSGGEIPEANADLMQAFDKGALALLYTGHGGVRGLTGDNVFTNAHIAALNNYDRMPFVYTATCEFTKYDNPLLVSAGEQLFLNPEGGCVALLTACRPTFGTNNIWQSRALVKVLTQRDEQGLPLRFGDIVRLSKCDDGNYSSTTGATNKNIRFLFVGDPALRLPMPQQDIVALKINGATLGNAEETQLHAMSMVNLEGEVRNAAGHVDTDFNGTLWARFFDKKSKMAVAFSGNNPPRNVYYHKDLLYQGKVRVAEGRFVVSFQVPKEIMAGNGAPRFSFYAYDSIRGVDAMGSFDRLALGGVDPAALEDDEGPKITFYWGSPEFENGQAVERDGMLCAELYDAQGIYHYDYSLGRDIMLSSNIPAYNNLVLNDAYEPTLNDFRRGKIAIPVADLEPGEYRFGLKVWDTQDNVSEAELWFVVDDDIFLSQVRNYPNPFSEETHITLTHLGDDGDFDVNIEIFDIMGRHVRNLYQRVRSTNGVIEPIRWDGCDNAGSRLPSGVYLYRLTLTDGTGYYRTVSQRMVIM